MTRYVFKLTRSNTVSGSVPIIQSLFPEELSCQSIQSQAISSFWKDDFVEGDDAFEDEGIGFDF